MGVGADPVIDFQNHLQEFFSAIEHAQSYWLLSSPESPGGADGRPSSARAFDECLRFHDDAFEARARLKETAPAVVAAIVPPSGQSPTQFVSGILEEMERAWHLCRFLHCIEPDVQKSDPDMERIRMEMLERLPALRNKLWESWQHIGHTMLVKAVERPADDSAFVLASKLDWQSKPGLATYKRLQAFLKKHPEIRTKPLGGRRFGIHAAEWAKFWAAEDTATFDALAVPAENVEQALAEAAARTASIPKKPNRKTRGLAGK